MSARDDILGRVRKGLGASEGDAGRLAAVERRIAAHGRHLIPARTLGKSRTELVGLLRGYLESVGATVTEVAGDAEVPGAIAAFLRASNLPARVRMGEDARLAALPWRSEPALSIDRGRATPADEVGLTHALAAVAETGTLLVPSGAENPVTLSFLPPTAIVLVDRSHIVGPYEAAWEMVRARCGTTRLPRTLNLISGPSRSADIGGVPVRGAHGPGRLAVIVVGEPDGLA